MELLLNSSIISLEKEIEKKGIDIIWTINMYITLYLEIKYQKAK